MRENLTLHLDTT